MDNEKRIEEIQNQIRQMASQLQALHNELNAMQGRKPGPVKTNNFSLENFIGLKLIHFVGIIILVIGLSIGVKYFIDKNLISELTRVILAYVAGMILFLLSLRLKSKYQLFSAILFSGAMASLYFTTYAAFVYYGFFSFAGAFIIMGLLTVYTAYEAINYNRQEIAILGMVGAYAIPFLISANAEKATLFFSYVILINAGIVFLSFRRKWKLMGHLALLISWTFFLLWCFARYTEAEFWSGLVIMIMMYILFMVNALAFRLIRSQALSLGDIQQVMVNNAALYLAALFIFGNGEIGNGAGTIMGFLAAFMIMLALLSDSFFRTEIMLQKILAMEAVAAVVLFIGFQWNGIIVTLLWVLVALVLFTWGIYRKLSWPRLSAILLLAVTLLKLIIFDSYKFSTIQKIVAYLIIGTLLLILSFLYQKFRKTLFGRD